MLEKGFGFRLGLKNEDSTTLKRRLAGVAHSLPGLWLMHSSRPRDTGGPGHHLATRHRTTPHALTSPMSSQSKCFEPPHKAWFWPKGLNEGSHKIAGQGNTSIKEGGRPNILSFKIRPQVKIPQFVKKLVIKTSGNIHSQAL